MVDSRSTSRGEIDTSYWFEAGQPTVRKVVQLVRRAKHEGDSAFPVILGPDNRVMDRMHRIVRL